MRLAPAFLLALCVPALALGEPATGPEPTPEPTTEIGGHVQERVSDIQRSIAEIAARLKCTTVDGRVNCPTVQPERRGAKR